jgi:hypothetical protein
MAREWRDAYGYLSDRRPVARGREWAIGDRLVCRQNDYGIGVRNGTQGTVVQIDRSDCSLSLRTDDGRVVSLPADYLPHAHHGYALTGHVSQGATVDRTFVLASPDRGGAQWAYVAASRQRLDLQVFVSHHDPQGIEQALAQAWSRSQEKRLALDRADPGQRAAAIERARQDPSRAAPEQLVARAAELAAAREQARAAARQVTSAERQRVAELRDDLRRAREGLAEASERHGRLSESLERTPVWRQRERGRMRGLLRQATRDVERHRGAGREAEAELKRLGRTVERVDAAERAGRRAYELDRQLDVLDDERLGLGLGRTGLGRDRAEPGRQRESHERGLGRER